MPTEGPTIEPRPHHRLRRAGPVIAVVAAVAILAAACSGGTPSALDHTSSTTSTTAPSPSTTAPAPSTSSPASTSTTAPGGQQQNGGTGSPSGGLSQAYAACMRSHGVPNFSDPGANGAVSGSGSNLNPGSAQFQAAMKACQSLA